MVIEASSKKIICTNVTNGRRHDFRQFKESGVHLHQETKVIADTGYTGINHIHSKSDIPKKRNKKNPLTKEDKIQNRSIASRRVPVEHAISHLKRFKILADKYRNRRKRFGLRLNLISAFYNHDLIIK